MAILEILQYPDPRLYTPADRVEKIDAATRKLVDDLAQTMYSAQGVGLNPIINQAWREALIGGAANRRLVEERAS